MLLKRRDYQNTGWSRTQWDGFAGLRRQILWLLMFRRLACERFKAGELSGLIALFCPSALSTARPSRLPLSRCDTLRERIRELVAILTETRSSVLVWRACRSQPKIKLTGLGAGSFS